MRNTNKLRIKLVITCLFFVSISGCDNSFFNSSFYDNIFDTCTNNKGGTKQLCSCIAGDLEKSYTDKELKLLTPMLESFAHGSEDDKNFASVRMQNIGEKLGYTKIEIGSIANSFAWKAATVERACKKSTKQD
ncbi:hypothetical protein [Shewanella sp. 125m-1]